MVGAGGVFLKRVLEGRVPRSESSSIHGSQAETIHARLKATFIAADSTGKQTERSETVGSEHEPLVYLLVS